MTPREVGANGGALEAGGECQGETIPGHGEAREIDGDRDPHHRSSGGMSRAASFHTNSGHHPRPYPRSYPQRNPTHAPSEAVHPLRGVESHSEARFDIADVLLIADWKLHIKKEHCSVKEIS